MEVMHKYLALGKHSRNKHACRVALGFVVSVLLFGVLSVSAVIFCSLLPSCPLAFSFRK